MYFKCNEKNNLIEVSLLSTSESIFTEQIFSTMIDKLFSGTMVQYYIVFKILKLFHVASTTMHIVATTRSTITIQLQPLFKTMLLNMISNQRLLKTQTIA